MNVEAARTQMVEQQVRAWEVLDPRVLNVLATIRRELFVPEGWQGLAFADAPIPLGHGEVMLTPQIEGRLLQALEVQSGASVLEIGTGSGFLTACLAALAGTVHSLDIFADFTRRAAANLERAGVGNATLESADATQASFPDRYDAVAIGCSLPVYDRRFERALEVGGRLFVVVGEPPVMEARRVSRLSEDEWLSESLFETVLSPMRNARRPPRFVF